MKSKVFIPSDDTILTIKPKLAEAIGLNASIVLLQLEYLVSISTTEPKEGKNWTYQSADNLRKNWLPFWSKSTIDRAIKKLIERNLVFVENFNRRNFDNTRWFAINYDEINKIEGVEVRGVVLQNKQDEPQSGLRDSQNDTQMVQSEAHIYQGETTIPETPTEITPKKKIKNAGSLNPARISLNLNNEKPADYDDVGKIIKLSIFDGYSKSAVDEYCSWFPEKYRELAMAYISGSLAIPPNSEWQKWREVYKILYDSEVSPEDLKLATFTLAVNGEEFYNTREVIKYAKLVCEQRLCYTENYQKYYRVMEEYFED